MSTRVETILNTRGLSQAFIHLLYGEVLNWIHQQLKKDLELVKSNLANDIC